MTIPTAPPSCTARRSTSARELALPDVEATALDGLGLVWRRGGDIDEARRCHEASRRVSSRFRTARGAARSAIQFGYVAEAAGDTEAAARLSPRGVGDRTRPCRRPRHRVGDRGAGVGGSGERRHRAGGDAARRTRRCSAPMVPRRSGTTIGSTSSAPNTRFARISASASTPCSKRVASTTSTNWSHAPRCLQSPERPPERGGGPARAGPPHRQRRSQTSSSSRSSPDSSLSSSCSISASETEPVSK